LIPLIIISSMQETKPSSSPNARSMPKALISPSPSARFICKN